MYRYLCIPRCFLQLLLDLSALMAVPSLRVFCLESTETLDEDPEGMFQVRKTRKYKQMQLLILAIVGAHPSFCGRYDVPNGIYSFVDICRELCGST